MIRSFMLPYSHTAIQPLIKSKIFHTDFDNFEQIHYNLSLKGPKECRFMAEEKKDSKSKRPTARKRDMQHEKRRLDNRSFKSSVRTAVRSFEKEISEKNETEVKVRLNSLFSLIDKGVNRGIYKVNKAGRLKKKFSNQV